MDVPFDSSDIRRSLNVKLDGKPGTSSRSGIACRSGATHTPTDGEEMAWFD